ncbi:hypothetical protein BJX99DRAFT_246137 [Aspergillus californicus]
MAALNDPPSAPRKNFPSKLPSTTTDKFDKLTPEQAGHLRHFHNLVTQPPGEWVRMGSQDPGQEWVDAYRYQLATMAYAAGAAHYHRLPLVRSVFKSLMASLIEKMLHRDVWGYWFLTSHSGKFVDPDLTELRKPWADPIVDENIMYSGHLLLMVSLYTMLFNDDRYNEPGALTFKWRTIFWGMGPESFSYTRQSLQQAILTQMEREKWLGVCCEPNSIFIVCNQFPLIAYRYNDIHDGTDVTTPVLEKYIAAWKEKGMAQENGLFINWYSPKQGTKSLTRDIGATAWASAFMNAWNPTVAGQTFQDQAVGFLSWAEKDRVNLNSGPVAQQILKTVPKEENHGTPSTYETFRKAYDYITGPGAKASQEPELPFSRPIFGYVSQWVSEVGDESTLNGLLTHAERFFRPTWVNGGLYYPANPARVDEHGNWTEMEPFTGNSALGYARLNVRGGQRKMWTDPWTPEHVTNAPFIDGIDLSAGVDFLRGVWDYTLRLMVVTMKSWDGTLKRVNLQCRNLPIGRYGIYHDGGLVGTHAVTRAGSLTEVPVSVSAKEMNLVLLHEDSPGSVRLRASKY